MAAGSGDNLSTVHDRQYFLPSHRKDSSLAEAHFRRNGHDLKLTAAESIQLVEIARKLQRQHGEGPGWPFPRSPQLASPAGMAPEGGPGRSPLPTSSRGHLLPSELDVTPPAVLVVDDRPEALQLVEAALQGLVPAIRKAQSGEEALGILEQEDFAVVLLDVRLSGLDGFEVARRMREAERTRLTPILFLTGTRMADSDVLRGYAAGAVDYLLKPLDPFILRSKVAVFIELYQKSREIERQARELERQQQFIDRLIRQLPVGMAFIDRSQVCRMVNSEFLRLTGLARGMVVGGSVDRALQGLGVDASVWQGVLQTGEIVRAVGLHSPAKLGKGRTAVIDMEALPIAGEGGSVEGVLIILHDTTRAQNEVLTPAAENPGEDVKGRSA